MRVPEHRQCEPQEFDRGIIARSAAGGLQLYLSQPQKTYSHGKDDLLCLHGLMAEDWGRVQGWYSFVADRIGDAPGGQGIN